MDLDILSALLPRPVSVYDLSDRFSIGDICRLEQLHFICRVGDEYRITDSGRRRLVVLTDQAQRLKDQAECNTRQESNKKRIATQKFILSALGAIFGWFFAHTSPPALFHKIAEWIKSLFH